MTNLKNKSDFQKNSSPEKLTGDDLHEHLLDQFGRAMHFGEPISGFVDDYPDCIDGGSSQGNDLIDWAEREAAGGKESKRRVPSQGGDLTPCPPITNRGGPKYQARIPAAPQPCTPHKLASDSNPVDAFQLGGYDGGIQVGFEGFWDHGKFDALLAKLEAAKQIASNISQSSLATLNGVEVLVEPSGANEGMHYKYQFTANGVRFLVHHKPPQGRQGVRIRYSAHSLIGRNLFALHRAIVAFLTDLGFTVQKEKLSRVDMQVLVECETKALVLPILNGHAVAKARKDSLYRNGGRIETYTLGQVGRLELCIYDKKRETENALVSDPVKAELLLQNCIDEEWFFSDRPITRVEFRLWREALKALGIDTVQELHEKEAALADWLARHWFRILEKPKVRGHENTAAVHPLWQQVQEAFRRWFPGTGDENTTINWTRREAISADPVALEKQAVGCLAKAAALRIGVQTTVKDVLRWGLSALEFYETSLFEKLNENAKRLGIIKGVRFGDPSQAVNLRDALDPMKAMANDWRETLERFFARQAEREVA